MPFSWASERLLDFLGIPEKDFMVSKKSSLTPSAALAAAKEDMVELIGRGMTITAALEKVERSRSWYESNRSKDKDWRSRLDMAKAPSQAAKARAEEARVEVSDFADFRQVYLNSATFPHQRAWIDVLEGRDPEIQRGWRYEPARPNRLLINTPPNHAKSMTVSIDYVVYRICMDPNVRVMLVSKTQQMAKKFLYAVKQRLTHPSYRDLQMAFGPEGGFKESADQWSAQAIYLGGDRDSGEKDPTVEAIGMGGQIYGARADLIICDDAITLANAHQWRDQMDWLRQEVASRLGPAGKLLVIGTRVSAQDLYRELRNPEHYSDKHTPWTYLGQPALLDATSDDPKDWLTLWPKSDRAFEGSEDEQDENGLYDRWTGPRLKEVRNDMGPTKWALVYQQEDVSSEMVFDPAAVQGSVDGRRAQGPITRERMQMWAPGRKDIHPEGFYKICAMDPAMSGDTATVSYAVDRQTRKRYVLDVNVMTGPTPAKIRELIQEWTELYQPHEWVVESNAFQLFLTQDEEIQAYLANKGIPMVSHYTGNNKADPEFGVASLAPLFGTVEKDEHHNRIHKGDNLISLPSTSHCAGSRMLCDQLVVWDPQIAPKHRKQDTIMALWFAELRARRVLNQARDQQQHFYSSPFTPQRDVDRQAVVSLDQWAAGNQPTMSYL